MYSDSVHEGLTDENVSSNLVLDIHSDSVSIIIRGFETFLSKQKHNFGRTKSDIPVYILYVRASEYMCCMSVIIILSCVQVQVTVQPDVVEGTKYDMDINPRNPISRRS